MTKEASVSSSFSEWVPKLALIAVCVLYVFPTTMACADDVVYGFVGVAGVYDDRAVRDGAEDEAKELSRGPGREVRLDWRDVPNREMLVEIIEYMLAEHESAVALLAEYYQPELNKLIRLISDNGVPVVMCGGDEPVSTAIGHNRNRQF
jgi:hypothetical protein